jgi:uncharacterized protein YndB with AHSA1/START domain
LKILYNHKVAYIEVAMENKVVKQIEIAASVGKVWDALTDHEKFGTWFRVKLEGPFAVEKVSRGYITWPGYEHLKWEAVVKEMVTEKLLSFTWHPYAIDPGMDYSKEEPTLVEFRLEPTATGTLVTVTESGFEKVPEARRAEAFRMNDGGWAQQMKNLEEYVRGAN